MALLMGGSLVLIAASAGVLMVGWLNANPSMIVASMAGLVAAGMLLMLAYVRSRGIAAGAVTGGAAPDATPADAIGGEERLQAELHRTEPHESAPVASVASPGAGQAEIAPLPVPGAASATAVMEPPEQPEVGSMTRGKETTSKKTAPKKTARSPARATKGGATKSKTSGSKGATPKTRAATSKATTAAAKAKATKQPPKVVVFDGRDKYHRPDCRFAKGRGAEKVTKATARRWGYEPCSICNP